MALTKRANCETETAQKIRPAGLALHQWRQTNYAALPASATAGTLYPNSAGTGRLRLDTENANNNAKTGTVRARIVLPQNYEDGTDITLQVRASTNGSAVGVSAVVDASVYRSNDQDGVGSDLVSTAAQTLTNDGSNQEASFTVGGGTLNAGDVLDVYLTVTVDDTGGSANVPMSVTGVWLETSTRM